MSTSQHAFAEFLATTPSLAVLSGAGISTGSGIPDYRDRNGKSKVKTPLQFQDFIAHTKTRQRYWSRSFVGWQRFSKAEPNTAHYAIADLEHSGQVDMLITQNVDGLHHRAGSKRVINLHGDLAQVKCLNCDEKHTRASYQEALQSQNGDWHAEVFAFNPDGDAELAEENVHTFVVPPCDHCGGMIKPDVVMFGEGVPKQRVADARAAVERCDGLLVIGSSLTVFSGFRFARQAAALGKPIAIVNQGITRADDLATLKLDADCEEILGSVLSCEVRA